MEWMLVRDSCRQLSIIFYWQTRNMRTFRQWFIEGPSAFVVLCAGFVTIEMWHAKLEWNRDASQIRKFDNSHSVFRKCHRINTFAPLVCRCTGEVCASNLLHQRYDYDRWMDDISINHQRSLSVCTESDLLFTFVCSVFLESDPHTKWHTVVCNWRRQ